MAKFLLRERHPSLDVAQPKTENLAAIVLAFISGGDIISQLYLGTDSIGGRDLRVSVKEFVPLMSDLAYQDIQRRRRQGACGKFFLEIPKLSLDCRCVSSYPSSYIFTQEDVNSALPDDPCEHITLEDSGHVLFLALARPVRVTELLIKPCKIDAMCRRPVAVSIDGGIYRNRMSAMFQDIALLQTKQGEPMRLTCANHSVWPNVGASPPVRFLRFLFLSSEKEIHLPNIVVYGVPERSLSLLIPPTTKREKDLELVTSIGHDPEHIDCILVDSPPMGQGRVPGELILCSENTREWKPQETMVPLVVLLRYKARITRLSVVCSSPVCIYVGSTELRFEPPFSRCTIPGTVQLSGRRLSLLIIAEKIEITSLAFEGTVEAPDFPKPPSKLPRSPSFCDDGLRRISTTLDSGDGVWLILRSPGNYPVLGFEFQTLSNFREIAVKYQEATGDWRIERFRIPECPYHCQWMLPNPIEMKGCELLLVSATDKPVPSLSVKLLVPLSRAPVIIPRALS
jgi:hypothetical protein